MAGKLNYLLQWHFTPEDFFEQEFEVPVDGHVLQVFSGRVDVNIARDLFESDPGIRDRLNEFLKHKFLAVQLLTHLPFELSSPNLVRYEEGGNLTIFMHALPANVGAFVPAPDFVITDASGNVVRDTRRERIQKKREFGQAAAVLAGIDSLFKSLLGAYGRSVLDPQNELVHLFEIREALVAHFGSEAHVSAELGISKSKLSEFGGICNRSTLSQGRHRGRSIMSLRAATIEELTSARAIAREMITSYLGKVAGRAG